MSNKSDAARAAKLKAMNDRGEYELVEPLDYLILRALPDEGELVMGYYPLSKSVKQIVTEDLKGLKSTEMVGPVRRLQLQRLIVRVGSRSARDNSYQRTAAGKKVLRDWEKKQPKPPQKAAPDTESGG